MQSWTLSERSIKRMDGLHPDIVAVTILAAKYSNQPFQVTQGMRTIAQQREYLASGASRTLDSQHLYGLAIDFHATDATGKIALWDAVYYIEIGRAMFKAAKELGIPIIWGGNWKTFKDYPHFHLARAHYPRTSNPNLPASVLAEVLDAIDGISGELNLVLGSLGANVRAVQTGLNQKLGTNLTVDGVFGPITLQAVKQFQQSIGVKPNGIVDDKTREAIFTP